MSKFRSSRSTAFVWIGILFLSFCVFYYLFGQQKSWNEKVPSAKFNPNFFQNEGQQKNAPNIFQNDNIQISNGVMDRFLNQSENSNDRWKGQPSPLIHFTWKSKQLPYSLSGCYDNWIHMNPSHQVLIWTDQDVHKFVYAYFRPYYKLFSSLNNMGLKSDLFRYMVLYVFGGVYTDVDTCPLKPISQWGYPHNKEDKIGLMVGIESDIEQGWEEMRYARQLQICQWTIRSVPNHPVLASIIYHSFKLINDRLKDVSDPATFRFQDSDVLNLTGPGMFTDHVMKYLNEFETTNFSTLHNLEKPKRIGDVVVLPVTGFSPGNTPQPNSFSTEHEQAMVQHLFHGTWREPVEP